MASDRHRTTVQPSRPSGQGRSGRKRPGTRAASLALRCASFGLLPLVVGCALPGGGPPDLAGTTTHQEQGGQRGAGQADGAATAPPEGLRPAGAPQRGAASYYAPQFTGRKMANGRRFDPRSTSVAHRSLPFGTRVLVTHLGNGRSATAVVEDRGPFVDGRIIDLSPRLAEDLGMLRQGVAPVVVVPVELAAATD